MDKFVLNPFSSETHSLWLIIYILFLNFIVFFASFKYIILMICLIPRIQQSIHVLTHDRLSLISLYCNHDDYFSVLLSNMLSFSFESILSSDIYVQKYIHNTHHMNPVVLNKDLSYKYTVASYRSFQAYFQCFFQPEIEFIETINKIDWIANFIGILYRTLIYVLLYNYTGYLNFFSVITMSRIVRMFFYFNASHFQHIDPNNDINQSGRINERSPQLQFILSIIFGKLSIEEGYGHYIHHNNSQIKSRYYSEIVNKNLR